MTMLKMSPLKALFGGLDTFQGVADEMVVLCADVCLTGVDIFQANRSALIIDNCIWLSMQLSCRLRIRSRSIYDFIEFEVKNEWSTPRDRLRGRLLVAALAIEQTVV